jgi:hypothetical protein
MNFLLSLTTMEQLRVLNIGFLFNTVINMALIYRPWTKIEAEYFAGRCPVVKTNTGSKQGHEEARRAIANI